MIVMDAQSITLAVLAGGAGTRMGIPKGWLDLDDQPILTWLTKRWSWPGPLLLVTAPGRQHPPGAEHFDRELVDAVGDQGPLRGMLTALDAAESDIVVIATCDMPLVRREQLEWVAKQLAKHPASLGLLLGRTSTRGVEIEPFPCALRRSAVELIQQRLATDDRSVYRLAELPQFLVHAAPRDWPAKTWTNLNRPEDLESLDLN